MNAFDHHRVASSGIDLLISSFRPELHDNAPTVIARYVPEYQKVYAMLGWSMFPTIDRVYVNTWARMELGWQPRHDFASLDRPASCRR